MASVRVHGCRNGNEWHRTEDLDSWLRSVLTSNHIDSTVKLHGDALVRLLLKLVEKGVLSVRDVIDLLDEYNVEPVDEAAV